MSVDNCSNLDITRSHNTSMEEFVQCSDDYMMVFRLTVHIHTCTHTHTINTQDVEANFPSLHFDTIVMYVEGSCFNSVKFFIPT